MATLAVSRASLDAITRAQSAFASFDELLNTAPGYRPTILLDGNEDRRTLARAYDAAQAARGDARRAFTGSRPTAGLIAKGDVVHFHAQNAARLGYVVGAGPRWARLSYVTKKDARAARESGRPAYRTTTRVKVTSLQGRWDGTGLYWVVR